MQAFLEEAKRSSRTIANLSTAVKNKVLNEMADALMKHCDFIISHNDKDMSEAKLNNLDEALSLFEGFKHDFMEIIDVENEISFTISTMLPDVINFIENKINLSFKAPINRALRIIIVSCN